MTRPVRYTLLAVLGVLGLCVTVAVGSIAAGLIFGIVSARKAPPVYVVKYVERSASGPNGPAPPASAVR